MAPNGEMLLSSFPRGSAGFYPTPKLSAAVEGLHRAMSDLSFEMSRDAIDRKLPTVSEVEEAKCECCGMSEEYTPGYIRRVRENFCGRWVCGLCSEAVKEEVERTGVAVEDALAAHMSVCGKFNRVGRAKPLLGQAELMREILKKCSKRGERGVKSPGGHGRTVAKGGIARSSSCMPAISKEMEEKSLFT